MGMGLHLQASCFQSLQHLRLGKGEKLGAIFKSFTWMAVTRVFEPSPTAPMCVLAASWNQKWWRIQNQAFQDGMQEHQTSSYEV